MKTLHRCTQALFAALLSMGLLFVVAGTASAHAKVLSATPAIGSTIAKAPTTVTVVCAENINPNPKLSNLFVYAPSGDLISQGDAKVSLSNPKEMSIGIKASDNGVYVVRWITVSADDGDPDQGAFVFTVKPTVAATGNTSTPASSTTRNRRYIDARSAFLLDTAGRLLYWCAGLRRDVAGTCTCSHAGTCCTASPCFRWLYHCSATPYGRAGSPHRGGTGVFTGQYDQHG